MAKSEEKEQRNGAGAAATLEDQAGPEDGSPPEGCPMWMSDWEKVCGRAIHPAPMHDLTPVCLMHSHDPEKSDAAFQEEFEAILKSAGDKIADVTRFVFPAANYAGREFTAACVFHEATFMRDAHFSSARFARDADFAHATFTKDADFNGTVFSRDATFTNARFVRSAGFSRASFAQAAHFGGAGFTQGANFALAGFTQHANFPNATFTEDAILSGAIFIQDADFRLAGFARDANFADVTFTHGAKFSDATFTRKTSFQGAKFLGPAEFRKTRFRQDQKPLPGPIFSLAKFSQPETVIFYKTYLGQALFYNCDVSKLNFLSVEWRRRRGNGKHMLLDEEVDLKAAPDLWMWKDISDERDYGLIAALYQQLKKNYDERKDYWTAGDFHYGEMEMKRLASRTKNKMLRWWHRNLSLVAWYKYASQYGESYARPALWLVTILFAFALLFPAAGLRYDPAKDPHAVSGAAQTSYVLTYWHPFPPGQVGASKQKAQWRLFGNSCVTALDVATFQRDRTYEPAYPWGRLLFLLELLLVPTLFGVFLLAVQRQFRR